MKDHEPNNLKPRPRLAVLLIAAVLGACALWAGWRLAERGGVPSERFNVPSGAANETQPRAEAPRLAELTSPTAFLPGMAALDSEPLDLPPARGATHEFRFRRSEAGFQEKISTWLVAGRSAKAVLDHYDTALTRRGWRRLAGDDHRSGDITRATYRPAEAENRFAALDLRVAPRGEKLHVILCLREADANPPRAKETAQP